MRFLNLDLDFFLDDVAYFKNDIDRLRDGEFLPWSEQEVRIYMENNCGLAVDRRIPGRIVEHHDQVFDLWKELISAGRVSTPFEVVHIDAHSDLGLGDAGYVYLLTELLHLEPEERAWKVDRDQIKFGNYLSFAVGCRWLSKLTYVMHPKSHNDLMHYHFKNLDTLSGLIQLRKLERDAFGDLAAMPSFGDLRVLEYEPEIPFETVVCTDFKASEQFDFVALSRSPGFTPPESDRLIPVVSEYIDSI